MEYMNRYLITYYYYLMCITFNILLQVILFLFNLELKYMSITKTAMIRKDASFIHSMT